MFRHINAAQQRQTNDNTKGKNSRITTRTLRQQSYLYRNSDFISRYIIIAMGTLGCIHDMMRRDKENRELRQRCRERMKETRRRMGECRHTEIPPTLSVEKLEKIKKQTQEKEQADRKQAFRITLYVGLIALFLILLLGIFLR